MTPMKNRTLNPWKLFLPCTFVLTAILLFSGCGTTSGGGGGLGGAVMGTLGKGVGIVGNVASPLLDPQLEAAATQEYAALVRKGAVPANDPQLAQVKRVAQRIIQSVSVYEGIPDREKDFLFSSARGFKWDVNVINKNQMNAFVMPGGKIAFYSGILPVAANDDGIAAIMGHEVSHALLRHGRDRVVQQMGVQLALKALGGGAVGQDVLKYAGMGVNYGLLMPWSRNDEKISDELGLALMTIAGYDPAESVALWRRMAAASKSAPPEFLSTHPSPGSRIQNLSALVPQYKAKYAKYIMP